MKKSSLKEIAIIIGIALVLRIPGLTQSLWLDEAITANAVSDLSLVNLFRSYMPGDFNPPLHYLLLWFWVRLFGTSEVALRFPSVLFGTGIAVAGYLWIKTLVPDSTRKRMLAGILLATAPLLVYYSQEARPYVMAAFFAMISLLSYHLVYLENKRSYFLTYWLATGLMFLTHYLTWLLWPLQILFLILHRSDFTLRRLKSLFLPLIWILPILPLFITQIRYGSQLGQSLPVWQSLGSFSLKQLALIPAKIVVGRIPIEGNFISLLSVSLPLLAYAVYFLWGQVKLKKKKLEFDFTRFTKEAVFLTAWLIVPVVVGAVLSVKLALFSYFRFLFIVPAFYLLLVTQKITSPNRLLNAVPVLFVILNFFFSSQYLFNPSNYRENWQGLVQYLTTQNKTSNVVIIGAVKAPFTYYSQSSFSLHGYSEIEKLRFEKSLWLITYAQPIFEPGNSTYKTLVNDYGFVELKEKNFRGDLTVKYLVNPEALMAYDNRY